MNLSNAYPDVASPFGAFFVPISDYKSFIRPLSVAWSETMEMTWVREGLNYYNTHLPEIAFTVGVIIILGLLSLPWTKVGMIQLPSWRGMMLRRARTQKVQQLMLDDFVDRIEERVFSTEITREEAKEVYRNLKKCFPVRDLFPSPELLKEAIQKRLAAHIHAPVDLPKVKRKHMFDK